MRKPSRQMPLAPTKKTSPFAWGFVGVCLAGLASVGLSHPATAFLVLFFIFAYALFELRKIKNIARSRTGESICGFARSFDTRKIDTRIIRAVYEELGSYLGSKDKPFPLCADDLLFSAQGLNIDSEDIDDVAKDIAFRSGRTLLNAERNPYFGKICRVADLVHFFMAQEENTHA